MRAAGSRSDISKEGGGRVSVLHVFAEDEIDIHLYQNLIDFLYMGCLQIEFDTTSMSKNQFDCDMDTKIYNKFLYFLFIYKHISNYVT